MSMGTLASRILGMARDMVLASLFSKTATDAFVVAFRLPNMFRRLLGEGSLSVSFIPVYVEKEPKMKRKAKPLANAVFTQCCHKQPNRIGESFYAKGFASLGFREGGSCRFPES